MSADEVKNIIIVVPPSELCLHKLYQCLLLLEAFYNYIYIYICDSMKQKLRSEYPENSGKSVITAPPFNQFPPKVDRQSIMSGCN